MSGFDMTGADGSPSAIESARGGGSANYFVTPLSAISSDMPFDAVLCLDVLFHVVDDAEWGKSMQALCNAVSQDGVLMIIETFGLENTGSPHVRWRIQQNYELLLRKLGFGITDAIPFQYPYEGADKTLLVCRREE